MLEMGIVENDEKNKRKNKQSWMMLLCLREKANGKMRKCITKTEKCKKNMAKSKKTTNYQINSNMLK